MTAPGTYGNDGRVVRLNSRNVSWAVTRDDGAVFDVCPVREPAGGWHPFLFEVYDVRTGRAVLGATGRFDDVVRSLIGDPR